MGINDDPPRILTAAMRERVAAVLAEPCPAWRCSGGRPRFTRRLVHGSVTVHIQCTGCGRSMSGALKRADFAHWQDFPPWDESIREEINAQHEINRENSIRKHANRQEEQRQLVAQRRADYSRWLLTSPEWRTLRDRVWRRAGGTCEACLANRAGDIHHVTYELGRLPPAWELRAVCRSCHDRLHDWTGGEE
jgi:hypothetical protein